jgi:hypothetical protein
LPLAVDFSVVMLNHPTMRRNFGLDLLSLGGNGR